MIDDNDGQMIFGDLGGVNLPDICLTGEEKPREKLTQETCPDRGSKPGPLRERRACYRLFHSGGLERSYFNKCFDVHLSKSTFFTYYSNALSARHVGLDYYM